MNALTTPSSSIITTIKGLQNIKLRIVTICVYKKKNYFLQANDTSPVDWQLCPIDSTTKVCCEETNFFWHKISWGLFKTYLPKFTLFTDQSKGVWFVSIVFVLRALYKTTAVKRRLGNSYYLSSMPESSLTTSSIKAFQLSKLKCFKTHRIIYEKKYKDDASTRDI